MKIIFLVTCFNRKELTISSLGKLFDIFNKIKGVEFLVSLVDDGSKDGTYEAVKEKFPNVILTKGGGDLYWAGGMRLAFEKVKNYDCNAYLLFNDDVLLDADAVCQFIEFWKNLDKKSSPILVGPTHDGSGKTTYSGYIRNSIWRPRAVEKVSVEAGLFKNIDMPNANFLMIDAATFRRIGGMGDGYVHSLADMSIGLRVKKMGGSVILFDKFIGVCKENSSIDSVLSKKTIRQRFNYLFSPKLGINDFFVFCKEFFPWWLVPIYVLAFFAKRIKIVIFGR